MLIANPACAITIKIMAQLQEVFPQSNIKGIFAYTRFTPKVVAHIKKIATKLKAFPIIHINTTAAGGGVAELLKSQIGLERSLDIESRWFVMHAPKRFFEITKKIHNMLQGKKGVLTDSEKLLYNSVNEECGRELKKIVSRYRKAIIMLHDPQPLAMAPRIPKHCIAVSRLHIDLLTPSSEIMEFVYPYLRACQYLILSNDEYVHSLAPWVGKKKTYVIAPAIDPFTEKNQPMAYEAATRVLEEHGINCTKPIITQVSRFDSWKDPVGVINGYYQSKNDVPELQLVLEGVLLAKDDPEAAAVFKRVLRYAKGDPDIHLFSRQSEVKNISLDVFVNALYSVSTVVIQKSIREGFGLTITEAMWKAKPVIAGITTGTAMQIQHRKNGMLIATVEQLSRAIVELIKNKKLQRVLGRAAHQSVKKKFLMSRYVYDHMELYNEAHSVLAGLKSVVR